MSPESKSLTYSTYLMIEDLLGLQQPKSDPVEHDEMLFIVIHQTYELWFKQVLHELGKFQRDLQAAAVWGAMKTLRRVLTILKTMVAQVDILETMTPLEFNSFRGFLQQASGFQSVQFREVEILCGLHSSHVLKAHDGVPHYRELLERRMAQKTLWESYCEYLIGQGHSIPTPVRVSRDGLVFEPSEQAQSVLLEVFRTHPEAAMLSELMVDFDEGLQEWRYRHVKMVERTIGMKRGTGGSEGARYLHSTLNAAIFPDLWAIRSRF